MTKAKALTIGLCSLIAAGADAAPLSLAQTPLFLTGTATPNVLVVLDNSESMDATMSGMLIAGSDAGTRGNIGRQVIRNTISNYRNTFNWGLMSYALSGGSTLYTTYGYYLGDATTMVFTDDCVGGISASNGNQRCLSNPQPFSGGNFVTYAKSGDDPDVNDVLYTGNMGAYSWGVGVSGTSNYSMCRSHESGSGWSLGDFSSCSGPYGFTPTDAGFLPATPPYPRQLWINRAWGYYANISGSGAMNEAVQVDSTTHFNRLMALLAPETNTASGEIKNAAVYTPVKGTFQSAKQYFSGTGGFTSPVNYVCQKNFVMFITDGKPTADSSGHMYSLSQQQNTYHADTGSWTFGTAATDAIAAIASLQNTSNASFPGTNFNVDTYVVALGNTVQNADAIAVMNSMAQAGGTGSAFLATDQAGLAQAIQSVTTDIAARTGSASSVSVNSGTLSSSSAIYQARFNSGDWSGQLLSFRINSTTGAIATQNWDAAQMLNGQNFDTGRAIMTYKRSSRTGIAFRWPANPASPTATEMDSAETAYLNANAAGVADGFGAQRIAFLRGSQANECQGCSPQFRPRPTSRLGDIVNSSPYFVAAPAFNYADTFESSPYSAFVTQYQNRRSMIYVGANDGMLHGFDAATGREMLAYVPEELYPNLSQLTSTSYSHRYYVDGTPTVGDVFYAGAWHTLLAGGFNAGGKGIYALDVTDPTQFTETAPGPSRVVRWEFSNDDDADMGYSFGRPSIVKMMNGTWAVIIGNGYNNTGSGRGVIYVINAETGALIKKFDTEIGSATTPNGVSTPTPIDTDQDGRVDAIYAGDLYGNLWKLDVSAANPNSWGFAFRSGQSPVPLFSAGTSATDTSHPITVRPDVGVNPNGGYMVYFGTGRYIDAGDNSNTTTQAFYGIRDRGATVAASDLQSQAVVGSSSGADSNSYRVTSHAVGMPDGAPVYPGQDNLVSTTAYNSNKNGWFMTLPLSGERSVTEPLLRGGKIIFNTLIPNANTCGYGGSGWIMELDALTGNRLERNIFDVTGNNIINSDDTVSFSFAGTTANVAPAGRMTNSIPAAPGIVQRPVQPGATPTEQKYINTSSGEIVQMLENAGDLRSGRVSWRQLQ